MSDGMRRELMYLSSYATNRYFIPNWGNVGHNAWQHHARNEVVDRGYVLIKLKLLYLFAGVAPWLLQNCLPKNANG